MWFGHVAFSVSVTWPWFAQTLSSSFNSNCCGVWIFFFFMEHNSPPPPFFWDCYTTSGQLLSRGLRLNSGKDLRRRCFYTSTIFFLTPDCFPTLCTDPRTDWKHQYSSSTSSCNINNIKPWALATSLKSHGHIQTPFSLRYDTALCTVNFYFWYALYVLCMCVCARAGWVWLVCLITTVMETLPVKTHWR